MVIEGIEKAPVVEARKSPHETAWNPAVERRGGVFRKRPE